MAVVLPVSTPSAKLICQTHRVDPSGRTILSTTFTKASIALVLMRLSADRRYRYQLWLTIVVNFGSSVGELIAVFDNCEPLQATWNPLLGNCGAKEKVAQISLVVSAFQIVTDWFCAPCPLFILRGLQMPRNSKYFIIGLLMLGGFASIATMLRIPYFKYYTITEDYKD
ncbi:integral membrane protein [Apiospora arundinis]|uniref:Integral membrane protein n=1 Tax=Apiospora arundinis TaxID=335852 RepID=A0ABR2IE77_9PEZI